jgi:hypothetical protein
MNNETQTDTFTARLIIDPAEGEIWQTASAWILPCDNGDIGIEGGWVVTPIDCPTEVLFTAETLGECIAATFDVETGQ